MRFVCADYLRVGKCKKSQPVTGYQKIALQRLTRQRMHVAQLLGKEKQYLSTNLFLKFSALKVNPETNPFSNTFSKTASNMLSDSLTTEEIANAEIEDLVIRISKLSRNRFESSEEVARMLKKASRDSYRLDKVSSDSVSISMASSFRLIRIYEDELKTLDREIIRLIDGNQNNYYKILTSIKGIGNVYAAGIIAEINDISLFSTDSQPASYAGLRWKKNQSGQKDSQHTKQTKACNTYLRYYLVESAGSIIRYNDEYAAYNIQIMVSAGLITMYGVYQNRTDYHTLPNMIERYYDNYNSYPLNLCADAGYGIYDNYRYLDEKKINNYVKYQNWQGEATGKNPQRYFVDENNNVSCLNGNIGKIIPFGKIHQRNKGSYLYHFEGCLNCKHEKICRKKRKNRDNDYTDVELNPKYELYKKQARENLQSIPGIEIRVNRSIQVEGAFGNIKQNYGFARLKRRGLNNVGSEIMMVCLSVNIRKFFTLKNNPDKAKSKYWLADENTHRSIS